MGVLVNEQTMVLNYRKFIVRDADWVIG